MFEYTNDNKRYHTLNYFYKNKFGKKVFKVSLNAGFSCPNKMNGQGCIFCSNNSGDFAGNPQDDIVTQFHKIKNIMEKKWPNAYYIGYFQAGTNTYAPLPVLKNTFETILNIPNVIGINIATRSDAIAPDVMDYLEVLNQKTFLTVELGLQSMHEKTLKFIHRGHDLANFENCVRELQKRNISVVVHIINGLPGETKEDMVATVRYLNSLHISGIKIHMLHILKNTFLGDYYMKHPFPILTREEYVDIVLEQLANLDPKIVIHRITGDPNPQELIAPDWLIKKFGVLNEIDKAMKKRNIWQGCYLTNHSVK